MTALKRYMVGWLLAMVCCYIIHPSLGYNNVTPLGFYLMLVASFYNSVTPSELCLRFVTSFENRFTPTYVASSLSSS